MHRAFLATLGRPKLLQIAGDGVDVAFSGTRLRRPLTLSFDAGPRPTKDAVPVVAHRKHDGTWELLPAKPKDGTITVRARSFSPHIPALARPARLVRSLGHTLASGLGGRTSPLHCSGAPSWFHLAEGHSDLAHVCATTNHNRGRTVAEGRLKSNRGVSVEVTVPGYPAYAWVEGQSWKMRQAYGRKEGCDPNRTVILPPGATMTVGYPRAGNGGHGRFSVQSATPLAFQDTIGRDLVSLALGGTDPTLIGRAEFECSAGLSRNPVSWEADPASIAKWAKCMTTSLVSTLTDEKEAAKVANRLGIGRDVAWRARAIRSLNRAGWIVALVPGFQLGWGTVADEVNRLWISNGRPGRVDWRIDPLPAEPPTSASSPTKSLVPEVGLLRGPAHGRGYWYDIRLSGYVAGSRVEVTCADSANPGGFRTCTITIESDGYAAT